jgi:hypothetical protein
LPLKVATNYDCTTARIREQAAGARTMKERFVFVIYESCAKKSPGAPVALNQHRIDLVCAPITGTNKWARQTQQWVASDG